jgi:hypothetical protein
MLRAVRSAVVNASACAIVLSRHAICVDGPIGPISIMEPRAVNGMEYRLHPSLPATRPASNRAVGVASGTRLRPGRDASTQADPSSEGASVAVFLAAHPASPRATDKLNPATQANLMATSPCASESGRGHQGL